VRHGAARRGSLLRELRYPGRRLSAQRGQFSSIGIG
jgi:hypothetical protein